MLLDYVKGASKWPKTNISVLVEQDLEGTKMGKGSTKTFFASILLKKPDFASDIQL